MNARAALLAAILGVAPVWASPSADAADVIIVNARVFAPGLPPAQAVAIRGDRITRIGARREIEALAGAVTQRIDARGGSLTPGFNDAHVHFLSGGLSLAQVNLLEAQTLPEVVSRIAAFTRAHPDQEWVQGMGWLYGAFPGGLPTRQLLDRIVPDRPAALRCYDGHTLWVNSKALALAGITRETADPPDGQIVRDAGTGEPTGVLKEGAQGMVMSLMPEPARAQKLEALRAGIAEALKHGVTSVQEAGADVETLELFEDLRVGDELRLRTYFALSASSLAEPQDSAASLADKLDALRARFPKLDIRAIKLAVDGVIEAHTAAMLEPYSNADTRGLPRYTAAELREIVTALDRRGWQLLIHAIGDAGVRMTLDALESAARVNPAPPGGRRHRVEHVEMISANDVARFASLGIIASMQPFHASPNANLLEVWAGNVGPERAARAWSWKSIRDAGGRLAFGTDWPVVGIDPRPGLYTAVTRQTPDGRPPGGFVPAQRLALADAIEAYTEGSAYAQFAEGEKGTISTGMLADLVLWDRDLFAQPVAAMKNASVVTTLVGGSAVFSAGRPSDSAARSARP